MEKFIIKTYLGQTIIISPDIRFIPMEYLPFNLEFKKYGDFRILHELDKIIILTDKIEDYMSLLRTFRPLSI